MCTAPSHLCDGCLQLYTPSRTLRSAFDILSFQSFLLPDFPLLVPAPLPSSAPLLTWNDLPLTLHLANVYCTVRLCVFCKWSEIFGGVIWWTNVGLLCVVSDGPANDCCTVCVLQTVQLVILYCVFCRRPGVLGGHGRQGVCELRLHLHPAVATGWHGPLPVQRLRPVPQDERTEQTPHQAAAETGEYLAPFTG